MPVAEKKVEGPDTSLGFPGYFSGHGGQGAETARGEVSTANYKSSHYTMAAKESVH